MKVFLVLTTLAALIMVTPGAEAADCGINGVIVATVNDNPAGPAWVYTLTVDWNTGSQNALSHISLLLDVEGGTCSCDDFAIHLSWGTVIGSSSDGSSCTSQYEGSLGCNGDPSIPGVGGIVLKFEPLEYNGCEPGTSGQAVFTFYSNLGPASIDENILSIADKFGQNSCFGNLSGDFPAMSCDPVASEATGWGQVKGMFR